MIFHSDEKGLAALLQSLLNAAEVEREKIRKLLDGYENYISTIKAKLVELAELEAKELRRHDGLN